MYQPNNGRRLHYATKSEAARLGFRHGDRARQEVRAPLGGEHAAGPQAQEQDLHGTYREACNELAKIQATRCDERAMPTVGQLYEARYLPWLERKYEGSESSTPNSYKRAWDSVCARRWADVPIDQIKPLEVQGWLDGMAYGNAHWALVVMRRTLDFAVNLDQIPANPFRRKYEMPRKSSEHQKNVYTLRQAEAMLGRVEGLPYEEGSLKLDPGEKFRRPPAPEAAEAPDDGAESIVCRCRDRAALMGTLSEAMLDMGADYSDGIRLAGSGYRLHISPLSGTSAVRVAVSSQDAEFAHSLAMSAKELIDALAL